MSEKTPKSLTKLELVSAFQEISAQEEMFRTLAESVPCLLWMTDNEGTPIFFNRQWLNHCGVTAEQALADWTRSIHPEDVAPTTRAFTAAVKAVREFRHECRLQRYDGLYRDMLATSTPRYDDTGNLVGYFGFCVDVSKYKDDQKKLIETNREIERRSLEISMLTELNDNLQVCKNIEETRPILSRYGKKLFPELAVSLCLLNASRNIVEPFVSWGNTEPITHIFTPDACWALRKGKAHTEFMSGEGRVCSNRSTCDCANYICIPLMAYGEVIGTLHIDFSDACAALGETLAEHKQQSVKHLASMAADQIALALANLQLRSTLHYQSTRDPLTQLFNRRFLTESLEREICRAVRANSSIGIIVVDIDHFKRYNDTYGHDAGDVVLREFALLLKEIFRGSDIACRYGGEEFAIVLPDAPREVVVARAEELRRRAAKINIEHLGQIIGDITISVGVAHYPSAGDSIETLLKSADRALYKAKSNGRNRVAETVDTLDITIHGEVEAFDIIPAELVP